MLDLKQNNIDNLQFENISNNFVEIRKECQIMLDLRENEID